MGVRWYGGTMVRWYGVMVVRGYGGTVARWYGGTVAWWHGSVLGYIGVMSAWTSEWDPRSGSWVLDPGTGSWIFEKKLKDGANVGSVGPQKNGRKLLCQGCTTFPINHKSQM